MSSGSDFVSMLVDMGFSKEKAERGLSMTGSKSVEAAMEWIFNHPEEFDSGPSSSGQISGNSQNENAGTKAEEAKSIKCDDCSKLFKTHSEVEFHANKSGHSNFSESTEEKKPMTEEERQEQLRKVEERLRLRRKEREEREKTEALLKEKARIQSGKDLTEARKKMEELEMKKIIEQRKREKEEERLARQRVKDLIEADKLARKGIKPEQEKPVAPVIQTPAIVSAPKDYTHTKIQIRLTNGSTLTESFSIKEPLAAVRLYVEINRKDDIGPFSLMTNFPRKVFQEEELGKTLEDLNLVPSAVLIVTKSKV